MSVSAEYRIPENQIIGDDPLLIPDTNSILTETRVAENLCPYELGKHIVESSKEKSDSSQSQMLKSMDMISHDGDSYEELKKPCAASYNTDSAPQINDDGKQYKTSATAGAEASEKQHEYAVGNLKTMPNAVFNKETNDQRNADFFNNYQPQLSLLGPEVDCNVNSADCSNNGRNNGCHAHYLGDHKNEEKDEFQYSVQKNTEISSVISYPLKPGVPDCVYYLKSGTCRFGSYCKFNHPVLSNFVEMNPFSEKTKTKYVDIQGDINDQSVGGSENNIGKNIEDEYLSYIVNMDKKNHNVYYQRAHGDPTGSHLYPIRHGVVDCAYFMKTGTCKFGYGCKFNHPMRWKTQHDLGNQHLCLKSESGASSVVYCENMQENNYTSNIMEKTNENQYNDPQSDFNEAEVAENLSYFNAEAYSSNVANNENCYGDGNGNLCHWNSANNEFNTACSYPLREGAPDCAFYMKTGTCKYGLNCKFNHPPRFESRVQSSLKKTAEGSENACNYQNDLNFSRGESYNEQCNEVQLDFEGNEFEENLNGMGECQNYWNMPIESYNENLYPVRTGVEDCAYYMRTGTCKFGSNCKFNHPVKWNNQMNSSLGRAEETCEFGSGDYDNEDTHGAYDDNYDNNLNNTDGYVDFNHNPDFEISEEHQIWDNINGGEYLNNEVDCKFIDDEHLPVRDGVQDCPYYMKLGLCKNGVNCTFNHPILFDHETDCVGGSGEYDEKYTESFKNGRSSDEIRQNNNGESYFAYEDSKAECKMTDNEHENDQLVNGTASNLDNLHLDDANAVIVESKEGYIENPKRSNADSMELNSNAAADNYEAESCLNNEEHADEHMMKEDRSQDCVYYMKTGACQYGSNCKFNHSSRKNKVGVSEKNIGNFELQAKNDSNPELDVASGEFDDHNFYPVRDGVEDCSYYMKTGTCMFGFVCKFNHPPRSSTKVLKDKGKGVADEDLEPDQTECKFYLRTGGCKFGKSCKFSHIRAKPAVELNFLGLPIRMAEKECHYFMRTGSCKYGAMCKFNHPEPSCLSGSDYALSVGNGASVSRKSSSHSSIASCSSPKLLESDPYQEKDGDDDGSCGGDEFPSRPGEAECKYFLMTGDCKYKSHCKFHHPKPSLPKSSPSCDLNAKGLPLRPGESACLYYLNYGICKFGPACKFDHADL